MSALEYKIINKTEYKIGDMILTSQTTPRKECYQIINFINNKIYVRQLRKIRLSIQKIRKIRKEKFYYMKDNFNISCCPMYLKEIYDNIKKYNGEEIEEFNIHI